MGEETLLHVEVVYPLPNEQRIFNCVVKADTNVEEIIRQSGVLSAYADIDLSTNKVGIF